MKTLFSIIALAATLFFPINSKACSCLCEYGENVSETLKNYDVFWGIPISADWKNQSSFSSSVTTKVSVLEDFNQGLGDTVSVHSAPQDGASCGLQLNLGDVQLITAYKHDDGTRSVGICNCIPPTLPLFEYLETGKDTYIPNPANCQDSARFTDTQNCHLLDDRFDGPKKYNEYKFRLLERVYEGYVD